MLANSNGDAKVIAGGQSLMPMLNFRLLNPDTLIDISRLPELSGISEDETGLIIGAGVRHRQLLEDDLIGERFPVIREAMNHVAHLAIRNRGTIGGSICHADPAAELPMLMLLLDASITARGPSGVRTIQARDFFQFTLTTCLRENEIVTSIHVPWLPEDAGWGFTEVARRHGDFALAGAAAIVAQGQARIAVMGVHETPLRVTEAEAIIAADGDIDNAIAAVRSAVEPNDDLQASADYRRHLVGVLAGRALRQARGRAT